MYHATLLHLVKDILDNVNTIKKYYKETIGNEEVKNIWLLNTVKDSDIVFTQECNNQIMSVLISELFYPIDDIQNINNGCLIFLKREKWSNIVNVSLEKNNLKVNIILAKYSDNKEYMLASCHGNSRDASDGRNLITIIYNIYLRHKQNNNNLNLIIGTDANTKSNTDINLFNLLIKNLSLYSSYEKNQNYTTIKKRMITTQISKSLVTSHHIKDYIISNNEIDNVIINSNQNMLPNLENLSDHYPVHALIN